MELAIYTSPHPLQTFFSLLALTFTDSCTHRGAIKCLLWLHKLKRLAWHVASTIPTYSVTSTEEELWLLMSCVLNGIYSYLPHVRSDSWLLELKTLERPLKSQIDCYVHLVVTTRCSYTYSGLLMIHFSLVITPSAWS